MPHDSHTTHEPDRVGRDGDDAFRGLGPIPGEGDDIHRQTTLLMFGGFTPPDSDPAPAIN